MTLQEKINKDIRALASVLNDYWELEAGDSVDVPHLWGKSLASQQQKIYRLRDKFKLVETDRSARQVGELVRLSKIIKTISVSIEGTVMNLKRGLDGGELLGELVGDTSKTDKLLAALEAERSKAEEDEVKQIEALQKEILEDSVLPPSAGEEVKDEGAGLYKRVNKASDLFR